MDVLTSKGPIRNPKGLVIDAIQLLNEYNYRKEFGLSHEEFVREPFDVYVNNMEIMGIRARIEKERMKRLERQAKK